MINPFYSVIINTYNNEKTIKKTLTSVIEQTFKNYEILLIDDASKDDTLKVATQLLAKGNRKYLIRKNKKNCGIAFSRNRGVKLAKGKYIAFIDGDDLWNKNKLMVQYVTLKQSSFTFDWIFSNYDVIDANYKYLGSRKREKGVYDLKSIVKAGNPIGMLTVVIKSEVLKNNRFRDIRHEDYDLWIRLSKRGYFGVLLEESLAKYMKHSNSISSNKFRSLFWTFNVFKKNGFNTFQALNYVVGYIFNVYKRQKF